MNRKFQSMLKQQWANRLLALFMCASLLLSSVAARPLAQSYDEAPPTPTSAPVVDTATPEPVSPTLEPATPTDAPATPTEELASPTAEPPVPTEESATPTAEPVTPTAEPASPTPTEIAPTQAPTVPVVPAKPVQAVNPKVVSGVNFRQLVIKFKNGYASSLAGQSLSAQSTPGVAPLLDLLKGVELKPFFSNLKSASSVQASSQAAQSESVLSRYFVAQLPESTDYAAAQQTLDAITALQFIDTAYMEPIYKPASTTPDYSPLQTYLGLPNSVDNGIGVDCDAPDPFKCAWEWDSDGGMGLGVNVYDIEQGWQIGHEDLAISNSNLVDSANSSQQDWVDHGTAVLGVIGAANNGLGVNGIAPKAGLWMVSNIQDSDRSPRSLADAINLAVDTGKSGDIIVIPLEALGPVSDDYPNINCSDADNASFFDIPVEYWQANFDAISAATDAGFVVVEAAGNGQMNLDSDRYEHKFDHDARDSGAIIVGAGTSDTRAPVCSTNFGNRIDLQGWGEGVTTTGYDTLNPTGDPTTGYTDNFGGTSAATAMVAGAVASFQGIAKDRHYSLTPEEVRESLHDTGTLQDAATDKTKNIGPLVNLVDAISKKIPETVTLVSPPDSGTPINTLRPTLDWDVFFNASQYELQVFKNGKELTNRIKDVFTSSTAYTFTSDLVSGQNYYWKVKPLVGSQWRDWSVWFHFYPVSIAVPATTLENPDNGYFYNNPAVNPKFSWKATTSPQVTGYELQISTASNFPDPPDIYSTAVIPGEKTHSFSGATLAPDTKYYWRVRSVIVNILGNNYGAWSSYRTISTSLLKPGLLDPPVVNSLTPYFDWTPVTNARGYYLQVAQNTSFSPLAFSATINIASGETIPHNFYQMTSLLTKNTHYYWRVRDLGKYGSSLYYNGPSFTTGTPPSTPAPSSPGINSAVTNPGNVVFKWSTPANAVHFWLQISTDEDFSDLVPPNTPTADEVDNNNASNPYPTALNSNTKYYWRVRAANSALIWSSWSSPRSFKTTLPDPTNPQPLVSPTDSLTPTFQWDVVPEASSYDFEILQYKSGACTNVVEVEKIITSSPPYTLTSPLDRAASFCWRVRAGGLYGYSRWVTVGDEFKTPDPPYAPTLNSPGNATSLANFSPILDWDSSLHQNTGSRGVNQYEVQVSTSKAFTILVPLTNPIVDAPTTSRVTLQLGAMDLPEAGTYYWHVRAVNTATVPTTYSAWSSTWSFLTPPQFEGTIYNAMTVNQGSPDTLQSVNLQISGTSWTTTTDVNGHFLFRGLPPGTYDVLISKGGYMRQTRKISFSRGNNINQDFDIVPIWNPGDPNDQINHPSDPPDQKIRIQLTWGGSVADMDANLWLPLVSPCLINKDNLDVTGCTIDPSIITEAQLIADDDQIYGTEVITIGALSPTTDTDRYIFAVLLNAAASKMGGSGAQVTVYDGTDLKGTFTIPSSAYGIWWKVFTLRVNGSTTTVTAVNSVGSKIAVPY
jgi:serine protease